MKKVLFVIGSLRKESFNRQLAGMAERMIADHAEVEYLDYSDLPYMNQDIEFPVPDVVERVRNKVKEADALWIFSPEYNSSYPGHLKNLIDWLSRTPVQNDRTTPPVIKGKKITVSGAGGSRATSGCREKLTELLTMSFVGADVMTSPQTGIALNREAWTEGRMILSEIQLSKLEQQAAAFIEFI